MAGLSFASPSQSPELPSLHDLLQEDEGAYIGIHIESSHWALVGDLEPNDYVHEVVGSVAVFGSGGDLLGSLGSYSLKLIDVDSALADRESVFDIFDLSASTIDYYGLYEKGGWNFKSSVLRALGCDGESVPCSLMIIDRLELLPKYRGMGVGLRAMEFMIGRFRMGVGMVAIKPFPLQFEGCARDDPEKLRARGLDKYPASEAVCMRRLSTHYGKLGFTRVPRTPFMCLPLIWGFRPPPQAGGVG